MCISLQFISSLYHYLNSLYSVNVLDIWRVGICDCGEGRRVNACFITSALNELHITIILCASTIMKHANRVIATILTNVFSKRA